MVSRRYALQGIGAVTGQHVHEQAALARSLGADLAPAARNLVKQVFEASGVRERHLELPRDLAAKERGSLAELVQAGRTLATRALFEALGEVELDPRTALLVCTDAPPCLHAGLAAHLVEQLQLPKGGIVRELHEATLRPGLVFGARLLEARLARDVVIVALSTRGSLVLGEPLPAEVTFDEVRECCAASDGAAVLHLSSLGRPGALLRYQRLRDLPLLQADGASLSPPAAAPRGEREGLRRWRGDLRRWLEEDAARRPTLLVSGGMALPALLAEPAAAAGWGPFLALSRQLYRDRGDLGVTSMIFALERALEEGLDFSPDLRFVALEPGSPASVVLLGGVELEKDGAVHAVAARRMQNP
ncbi:MAG: hypothetical protein P1V51_02980 [Deltaproteobacteria bacterium]|nr:hypothetical protein [Deltaproteobacteria bacterium]